MTILLVDLWLLWCVFFFGLVSDASQQCMHVLLGD
jgi:hypothetical protein